jgi:hypothetical protein
MEYDDALSKAQELWGDRAFIHKSGKWFLVGTKTDGGSHNETTGLSDASWDDALDRAIRNQVKRREAL